MRTAQALSAGIEPRTLYWMRDNGIIDRLSRGVYHLRDHQLPSHPDVVTVMSRIPRAVLCLTSALSYYEVGTHIPSSVYVALPHGVKTPRIAQPRISVVRMSEESLEAGVVSETVAGTTVQVFSMAKTIADCFKFRNRIGMDIALEALQEVIKTSRCTPGEIMSYAKVNRVDSVIRPYLEALV